MTVETKPVTDPILLQQALTQVERQVIVHCCFAADDNFDSLIRIWRTTYLIDSASGHKCELLHAENISFAPNWTEVPPFADFWFTLVFSGLPRGCKTFDLKEIIAEEGGFHVTNIRRNSSDIYRVKI